MKKTNKKKTDIEKFQEQIQAVYKKEAVLYKKAKIRKEMFIEFKDKKGKPRKIPFLSKLAINLFLMQGGRLQNRFYKIEK